MSGWCVALLGMVEIAPDVRAEVWENVNCSRCGGWNVRKCELFQVWGLKCEKAWIVQMWGLKCEKVWIVPDMWAEVWKNMNCSRCGGWSVRKCEKHGVCDVSAGVLSMHMSDKEQREQERLWRVNLFNAELFLKRYCGDQNPRKCGENQTIYLMLHCN